ncbi:hypothetical protein P879_09080 [Paragonimus westermani]|uniref:Uncharacterized protein n=1 Tax=Paragonimus westermani TaxID=34504 RepID=A0A8T0CYC0_9TREM|nr:hypothetical protein P879_09080 [Paragonimus westermani]
MPSSRAQSEEKIVHVTVPAGSEKVIGIRQLSKNHKTGTVQILPLTVNTGDQPVSRISETELQREVIRRQTRADSRHSRSGKPKDDTSRRSQVLTTVSGDDDAGRVLSCLEVSFGDAPRTPSRISIQHDTDTIKKMDRSPRKSKSRERTSWLSSKTDYEKSAKWRLSSIFAPESPKRQTSRHLRKTKSMIIQPSQMTPAWSPYTQPPLNYYPTFFPTTCPKCAESLHTPVTCVNQEGFVNQHVAYVPYPANNFPNFPVPQYSMETIPPQVRRSMPQNPYYHHHHHALSHRGKTPSGRTVETDRPPHMMSQGTLFSTSAEDLGIVGQDNGDRTLDLMEIEYATMVDDDGGTRLSPKTLQSIIKLARECSKTSEQIEEIAKQLKLALDDRLGEKWHVIVGDDTFGSNLASLPGALANFKISKNVFLVWQT